MGINLVITKKSFTFATTIIQYQILNISRNEKDPSNVCHGAGSTDGIRSTELQ
jgi:hypothetical protein